MSDSRTIDLAVPANAVFDLLADWRRMATWTEGIDEVTLHGADALALGVTFSTSGKELGFTARLECRVTAFDPPRAFGYSLTSRHFDQTVAWTVTPLGADRCRVECRMTTHRVAGGRLLRTVMATMTGRQIARHLGHLKRALES